MVAGLGELGLCGLYVPEQYGGQGLSQTGYCRVFETFAQIDATVSVVMGVHQSIGMKGIVLFGSDEQKERFLPDLAAGRKLAGFALTEPNAGSDAYNIESRAVREAGRQLEAERREVLHRQRRQGLGVRDVRAHRDRRPRPPHRLHPREGHGGLRDRSSLRHDGPARERPAPALLQGRPDPAGERARRARRGLQDRDAHPQQRASEPRHRLGGRGEVAARRGDRPREHEAPVRPPARPTSSSCRRRSAGWSPTSSGSSRWPT